MNRSTGVIEYAAVIVSLKHVAIPPFITMTTVQGQYSNWEGKEDG